MGPLKFRANLQRANAAGRVLSDLSNSPAPNGSRGSGSSSSRCSGSRHIEKKKSPPAALGHFSMPTVCCRCPCYWSCCCCCCWQCIMQIQFSLHTFWRRLNKLDAIFVCSLGAGGIGVFEGVYVCVCLSVCSPVCRVNYADQTQRLNASTTTPNATTTCLSLTFPPRPHPLDAFEVRSLARRTIVYNFYS